jgi:LPXTG-site transpeptidase (sortase) family protein
MQLQTNEKVKAAAKTLSEQTDGSTESDVPSETPPEGGLGSYQVSSLSPRLISIPKIDVVARTLRLGVKPNNELKAPSNIFDAGWFEGSARPGEPGAMLVSGHVHGPTKPGVFTNLKKLVEGDRITIERGDGKKFNYRVVKVQSYDKDSVDMGAALNSAEPGKPGLNLITCDGAYDEDGHYKKRLIVFAVQE